MDQPAPWLWIQGCGTTWLTILSAVSAHHIPIDTGRPTGECRRRLILSAISALPPKGEIRMRRAHPFRAPPPRPHRSHAVPCMLAEGAGGSLLDIGGVRLYPSGDTEYDHTMRATARANVDVMLVCINGTAGNMNAHEAALLAWQVRPRMVVPMHFGLWIDEGYTNLGGEATLDPQIFVDTYRKLGGEADVVIPEIGERILVNARAAVAA